MDNLIINRKSRRDMQWRYILKAIDLANPDTLFVNDQERIETVAEGFRQYLDTRGKFYLMDLQRNLAEWLATAPNCIALDHDTNVVMDIGKAWGYKNLEKFAENFYSVIAQRLDQMSKILNIRLY